MKWLDEMEPQKMVKEYQEETLKSRRAISPVIATVIIVAVTITVAVAVSFWMRGIAGQYTSFEKVELKAHYSKYTDDVNRDTITGDYGWNEYINLKNSGSKDATITDIFINNIPLNDYAGILLSWIDPLDVETVIDLTAEDIFIPVLKGTQVKIVIGIPLGTEGCTPGTTINMKIITAAGNQYPLLETLA